MSRDRDEGEGVLGRWSRLKQAKRERAGKEEAGPEPESKPVATPETEPGDTPPPDLPDIDSLDKDSDYTVFMGAGVPEALRSRALRKLWRSDPVLANLDGLNDYDEDFTVFFRGAQDVFRTATKVGEKLMAEGDKPPPEPRAGEGELTADDPAPDDPAPDDPAPDDPAPDDPANEEDDPNA